MALIPIFMYHHISTYTDSTPLKSLFVSPARFRQQMSLMSKMGYTGLSMRELEPYLQGIKKGRVFGITFDDGYLDNLLSALPVLQEFGFTSTCYLVSGLLGQENVWDKSFKDPHPLMSIEQIKVWLESGQDIGAHTVNHINFTKISPEQADIEILNCKKTLEATFNRPIFDFCYPYGAYNETVIKRVKIHGFKTATTTHRSVVISQQDSMFLLPRLFINDKTTKFKLLLILLKLRVAGLFT